MATLTLTSTDQTINVPLMTGANLLISTDITFTSPPATVTVVIREIGLIPDTDFAITDMVWLPPVDGMYEGSIELPYTALDSGTPYELTLRPLAGAVTGVGMGEFQLHANGYTVGGTPVEITFTGIQNVTVSPTAIDLSVTVNESVNQSLFILNESNNDMEITAITINPALTDLSVYFPAPVTIPVGEQRGFVFTFAPTTEFAPVTNDIVFTRTGFDDLTVVATLESVAVGTQPTIVPNDEIINLDVIQNVNTGFTSSLVFSSNNDSGTFEMTSSDPDLRFGSSLSGDNATYREYFVSGQSYSIPFAINTSDSVGIKPITLTWRLLDDDGVTTMTSGTILLNVLVGIPEAEPTCQMTFLDSLIQLIDLRPLDEGVFSYNLLSAIDLANTDNIAITLTLPTGESYVSFDTAAISAINVAGLTYDDSNVGNNPSELTISVDSSSISGSLYQIEIPMAYSIPASPESTVKTSYITMSAVYANPDYACTGVTAEVYMGIILSSTAGGYETKLKLDTAIQCQTLTVTDDSNFGADYNHDANDFSIYRKMVVTYPNGIDVTYSTHAPYDTLITPASSSLNTFSVPITSGGIYTISLEEAPAWGMGTYSVDDCVVVETSGVLHFYKSLSNGNTEIEPGATVGWEDWWEEITTLPSEYTDMKYYMQWCEIANCKKTLQRKVFCDITTLCRMNLCNNKCFENYEKLKLIERMLAEAEYLQWYDKMVELYNMITELCECSNCE